MCNNATHLIYGVIVKTWLVFIAAKAHPKLIKPVLALDLIMMRFRDGTLATQEGKVMLPPEIWEMVKLELVDIELCIAETAALIAEGLLSYAEPRRGDGDPLFTIYNPYVEEDSDEESDGVGIAYERMREQMIDYWFELWGTHVDDLLKAFGFSTLLGNESLDLFDSSCGDFNLLLTPIAISFNNSTSAGTSRGGLFSELDHDAGSSASVAFISPDIFTQPSDPLRFKRLVKYYRLDLADAVISTFNRGRVNGGRGDIGEKEEVKKGEGNNEGKRVRTVEPKWMLWSHLRSCT